MHHFPYNHAKGKMFHSSSCCANNTEYLVKIRKPIFPYLICFVVNSHYFLILNICSGVIAAVGDIIAQKIVLRDSSPLTVRQTGAFAILG